MTSPAHHTALADVAEHPSGWATLPTLGVDIMRLPLRDQAHPGLFARLDYAEHGRWCDERDLERPAPAHLEAARAGGLVITPWTEPDTTRHRLLETSAAHDQHVATQLASRGWAGDLPVVGAGKEWVSGASPGRSRLMGWWVQELARYSRTRRGPGWVQQGTGDPHGAHGHYDYATLSRAVRPTLRLGSVLDVGPVSAALDLLRSLLLGSSGSEVTTLDPGAAVVRVAQGYVQGGLRELTGRNDGPAIGALFAGCTRLVAGVERPTGWVTGWDWCAAFASLCVHVGLGLAVGSVVPVGRRIAVRELVEDARRSGRLRGRGYSPRPGDLWIGARGGGDPLLGGTGHVRVFAEALSVSHYIGVGGNEGNRVTETAHRYDDPTWRAWIAVAA